MLSKPLIEFTISVQHVIELLRPSAGRPRRHEERDSNPRPPRCEGSVDVRMVIKCQLKVRGPFGTSRVIDSGNSDTLTFRAADTLLTKAVDPHV